MNNSHPTQLLLDTLFSTSSIEVAKETIENLYLSWVEAVVVDEELRFIDPRSLDEEEPTYWSEMEISNQAWEQEAIADLEELHSHVDLVVDQDGSTRSDAALFEAHRS